MKYTDPTGTDIKGVFRGLGKVALAGIAIKSGLAIIAASGIGEVASAGSLTVPMVAAAVAGYGVFISGIGAMACSLAETAVEIADCFTDNAPDGDYFPSGIGGCIGMGIDSANGYNAQEQKSKGNNQIIGESIETLANNVVSTASYGKSVMENAGKTNLDTNQIIGILKDEASHQYDMYTTATTIGDLTGLQEEK